MRRFTRKKKVELKEGEVRPPKKKKRPIESTDDPRFRAFIMSALRSASRWWAPSEDCIKRARVGRGQYMCEICSRIVGPKEIKKDHILPVIPVTGFVDWDLVVKRMFVDGFKYQAICKEPCHKEKTDAENKQRKQHKAMAQSSKEINDDDPDFS